MPLNVRTLFSVVVICLGALSPIQASAADLNPPPFPGSRCQATGSGTTCFVTFEIGATNVPAGFKCGSVDILETFSGSVSVRATYNSAGDQVEEFDHIQTSENTWLNPVSGKSVSQPGTWNLTFALAVPGDFSTATVTLTGLFSKVVVKGSGVILHDAGRAMLSPDGTQVLHGPHQLILGDFTEVCAALS
jgi:hypothetical protein